MATPDALRPSPSSPDDPADAGARLVARGTPWWIALAWLPVLVLCGRWRALAVLPAAAVSSFFRDPGRRPAPGVPAGAVLAAADGRVREVVRRDDGRWLVSTYLGLYNVHVGRAPLAATVTSQVHVPGAHAMAFDADAQANERMEWRLATEHGELEMTQYSGAAARRIVPYLGPGATLRRGQRLGLIRFGSRVDLLLPAGLVPTVVVGQRPRAGRDVVAVPQAGAGA